MTQWYHLVMRFSIDVGFKDMKQIMEALSAPEPILEGGVEVTLTQDVPFIPTKETISAYEKVFEEKWETDSLYAKRVRFKCYDEVTPIEEPSVEKEKKYGM